MKNNYCPYKYKWGTADTHTECDLCNLWEDCINKRTHLQKKGE